MKRPTVGIFLNYGVIEKHTLFVYAINIYYDSILE
jgi:hypothetical protein